MSALLVALLGAAGITGLSYWYFRRAEKMKLEKELQQDVNLKSKQAMLDSPHRPWTPDFHTVGSGYGDAAAYQRASEWDAHHAELRRKRLAAEAEEEDAARRRLADDSPDRYNMFGMGYTAAVLFADDTPSTPTPEPFVGGGGTFDGGGASGDWKSDPTPEPSYSSPEPSYSSPEPSYTPSESYSSPDTSSYSSSDSGSSFSSD